MRNRVARSNLGSACRRTVGVLMALAGGALAADGPSSIITDGFESPRIAWRQEQTDATVKIFSHDRTNRAAHEGVRSEGFQFEAGIGGGLYFSYALPKIPVTEDLKVGLYVRSNRAGIRMIGRVILPNDVDPDTRRPSFVHISSEPFENADRWQKLELTDLLPAIEQQARVLRSSTRRKVSLEGAYLERLVVNLYAGEGETEVYLDELTVGPVDASVADAATRPSDPARGASVRTIADRPRGPSEPLESVRPGANTRIKLDRNRLTKDGFPWFFTAVRAPDVDPAQLRRLGADVQIVPRGADEEWIKKSVASGLLLIPELTGPDDRTLPDPDRLASEASAFPSRDSVAFWSLGEGLGTVNDLDRRKATLKKIREANLAIHKLKPGGSPFTTGTVEGMLPEYSRIPENLDVIGIPTAAWATMQGPKEMYQFLEQRRTLTARSNADALFWAILEATPPPIYREAIWGTDAPPAWGSPRIQPEQLRTATYAAIAAGMRGICYRADSGLNAAHGRPNMIEMALLNEEIDLLEPILGDPDKAIRMVDTYQPDPPPPQPIALFQTTNMQINKPPTPKEYPPHPTITAAAITTKDRRGTLLMLADYSKYAQFQPPQGAFNNLKLLIPAASDARAYLISPGGVVPLDSKRAPGGLSITLEDFGLTAIVLVTTNVELKDQIEQSVNRVRPLAANLAIEQAELQRAWVIEIDSLLQDLRHPQKDSVDLLNQSGEFINSARAALAREDYPTAWDEARRAGRPLRVLMRYHFMSAYDEIVKILNDEDLPCGPVAYEGQEKPKPRIVPPVVAAPLASFATLPQAWIWADWIRTGRLGQNLIEGGHFDDPEILKDGGWVEESYQSEDVETTIKLNEGGPDKAENGSYLSLSARPRKGLNIDSLPPADHAMVAIRSPSVKVGARQVYRISVMAHMKFPTAPGAGGLIVRDSIGGERLQFRTPDALDGDWFEIVYYRRVPVDGTLSVTLGMAGYNSCEFDDLKVEPIVETVEIDTSRAQVRPRRRPVRPATETTAITDQPEEAPATATRSRPIPIRE
ncbi:hypothetical protein P12x_000410 [Tundrisphaera lichenicola]|uniref:hypothetical protein n=1 Tax=Tundrisphaera lichenicola TaxID=2029860 RepID=UPI003EBAF023